MAAGLGFKDFQAGSVVTAADTNGYLMQGILVFATTAARDAAITSPQEGQFAYIKADDTTYYYTGSAWAISATDNTAYTAFTPAFWGATPWTAGDGTFTTRYKTVGKLVHYYGHFTFGSTSVVGASTFGVTLPVNAATTATPDVFSTANFRDLSGGGIVSGISRVNNATQLSLFYSFVIVADVFNNPFSTVTAPFIAATGDVFAWNIVYERA